MTNNYALLLSKISEFKQKFYLNRLLRGSIYTFATLLGLYLIAFLSVYFIHPSVITKTILFIGFVFIALSCFFYWLLLPLFSYLRIGKTISDEEAAKFIGVHFLTVKDKLLNTIQLHTIASLSTERNALILAGIDQKIMELKPIPFARAVTFEENRKYLKYLFAPLIIILLIALIYPSIIKEGSYSFLKFNREIIQKAPFQFNLLNKSLSVTQGDDVALSILLTGDELPQDVYLEDGLNSFKLEKKDIYNFTYTVKNLQETKSIRFTGGGFTSERYTIQVNPRPLVLNIKAELKYPAYLNKPSEEINNVGDLIVPDGTEITWKFRSEHSNALAFAMGSHTKNLEIKDNVSHYTAKVRENTRYKITVKNNFVSNKDSIAHNISVIKDQFPSILVKELPDSLSSKIYYYNGSVADDHGFTALTFFVNVFNDGKKARTYQQNVPIKQTQLENVFFHTWRMNDLKLNPGETVEYYFEISDNDGVNGPKSTQSTHMKLAVPTAQEIAEKINYGSEQLKQKMDKAIKLAGSVEKESKKLSESLLDKKQITYEDKKQIEQLLSKQKDLEQVVKEIKELNDKNNFQKEENSSLKEELAEKQQQINDLFNNVLDEKTKNLLKLLEKVMQENNKEQTKDQLSKMQLDNKSLKNELDRILELYKQLEVEQSLQNAINRLKDLSNEQQKLANDLKSKKLDATAAENQQKELSKEFNNLSKELEKVAEKDALLDRPSGFKAPQPQINSIKNDQNAAEQNLKNKQADKASQNQEQAAKELKNLANELEEEQNQEQEKEANINAEELRKLLGKLLTTSFDQEKIMLTIKTLSTADPLYINQVQKQRVLKDNLSTIADSLYALSKRVPQIETTVNAEMQKIDFNLEKSLENLGERRTAEANRFQQFTMTSVNNLALMLNEALEQLQNMKKQSKGGKGGKKGMQQVQALQEQLNKNMQQAKQELEKNGNKGTVPKGMMSEQFAKMAQQQQMIREALQKINREDNKDGKGSLGNLNQLIQDMKATENDLVNKRIEQQTLNRQKDLLTKLLNADKAQREQEQDAQRSAKAAKEFPPTYKQLLDRFNKIEQNETELLQKMPAQITEYYKLKIAEYYKLLNPTKK